jgi:uncharacterized C2H2 Zn-finger protein
MAMQECPRCGARFSAHDGWAKVALSTLMIAPAVPDMATQVRCPRCQYLFAEGEVRYSRSRGLKGVLILCVLGAAVLLWTLA